MGARHGDDYQPQYQHQQYGTKRKETPPPVKDAPPPAKTSKWGIVSMVFALLTVVMLGASIALPWYSDTVNTGGKDYGVRWGLLNAELLNETGAHKISFGDETLKYNGNVAWTMKAALGMLVLAMIFSLLLIPVAILAGKGKMGRGAGMAMGVLAIIFCLLLPVVMMVGMPMANKRDIEGTPCGEDDKGNIEYCKCSGPSSCQSFQGSKDLGDRGMWSWGGSWGWMLSWAAWAFSMMATAALVGVYSPKKDALAPAGAGPGREPGARAGPGPGHRGHRGRDQGRGRETRYEQQGAQDRRYRQQGPPPQNHHEPGYGERRY